MWYNTDIAIEARGVLKGTSFLYINLSLKNMNKLEKIVAVLGSLILALAFMYVLKNPNVADGSVALGNEYLSTSTRTAITGVAYSTTTAITANSAVGFATAVSGTLGSIVIEGANTGQINIYDGTSTITNTQIGTTTLATIPASAAAGTYTFDTRFRYGLVIEVVGLAPTTTITYRAQ